MIHKFKGARVRLDTTLVDFNDMHWVRGDISFIYNGDAPPEAALAVLDNQVSLLSVIEMLLPEAALAVLDNQVSL